MRRRFHEELFSGMIPGLLLGLFYGSLRAFFFYDTIGYFAWGFKEISPGENIYLKSYIICFYLLFGAVLGIVLRLLYLWGISRFTGRERRFTLSLVSSLLCLYSFLNVSVYVNCYKFLTLWGEKSYIGGFVVRRAVVTPLVIITNVMIVFFFIFIRRVMIRTFTAIDASRKIPERATKDALVFSISLGYFAYFSLLAPVNNRMPHLTSPASIIGNILLVSACLVLTGAAYLCAKKVLRECHRRGRPFLKSLSGALPASASCAALAVGLIGAFHCACIMESPGIKYFVYVKAPREIIYSLFYLNKALDFDGDGYSWVSPIKDLDHFDAAVHPMAADIPFNSIDEDGVGGDMADADLDGHDAPPHGGDCDDACPATYPGAPEVADGRDNNCDGAVDNMDPAVRSYAFDPAALNRINGLLSRRDLNILVVLMDALAAGHMSCYGYFRQTTPAIDAFSREAVLFEDALTPSTGTEQSLPSIMLSQHPSTHRLGTAEYWRHKGPPVPLQKTFADLKKDDFLLVYLSATRILDPLLDAFTPEFRCDDSIRNGQHKVRGDKLNERAFSFLKNREKLPNLFLVLHYYDTHWLYTTPREYAEHFGHLDGEDITYRPRKGDMERNLQYMIARYDGAILYADHLFGLLVDHLRSIGQYDNSIIIVTADHGEQFMQHGGLFHNMAPYREVQHVPLIMRLPGGAYGGVTIGEPVQLIDLMPTLFALLDIEIPKEMEGKSLLPLIAAEGADLPHRVHRFIFAETENYYPISDSSAISVQDNEEGYKYIFNFFTGEEDLYDIRRDPLERKNLSDEKPSVRERLKKVLFNFKSSQERKFEEARKKKLEQETAPEISSGLQRDGRERGYDRKPSWGWSGSARESTIYEHEDRREKGA